MKHMKNGFTLIELMMILSIIGLILAGIMTGGALIKNGSIKSTIAQITNIKSAINSFKSKYDAVPGDIHSADAQEFGLSYDSAHKGERGKGDGDGIILGCDYTGDACSGTSQRGEPAYFWIHLKEAKMLQGSFSGIRDKDYCNTIITSFPTNRHLAVCDYNTAYLKSKLNESAFFIAYSTSENVNVVGLSGIRSIGAFELNINTNLLASDVYQLDKKIDDGDPFSGSVIAIGYSNSTNSGNKLGSVATNTRNPNCITASGAYNIKAQIPNCALQFNLEGK